MIAEVLAIGDELVHGHRQDTNGREIAAALDALGVRCQRLGVVGDEPDALVAALGEAAARADVLVLTGGLGPTEDDRTRAAAAAVAGEELVFDDEAWTEVKAFFDRIGREPSASNRRQAERPASSTRLPNAQGTAPGFAMRLGRARVFALPGVPSEMRAMLAAHVLPALVADVEGVHAWRELQVFGCTESALGERLERWMLPCADLRVGITAHMGLLTVRVGAFAADAAAAAARADAVVAELRPELGRLLVHEGPGDLATIAGALLLERQLTVAIAESCTGGLVTASLTEVPGISAVLGEAHVTYSNAAKQRCLGIDPGLLDAHGAVSEAVAAAMAAQVATRAGARIGLATTGIAGPGGGTPEKPVGTVCFGLALDGEADSWTRSFGDLGRTRVRHRSVQELFGRLIRRLHRHDASAS